MVCVSWRAQCYRCQRGEKGGYLSGQISARVGEGLIGVRSPTGIERYRSRSFRIPVALSRQQFEDTYAGFSSTNEWITLQPVVGQRRDSVRWNPPVRGESNGVGFEESAWL